MAGIWRLAYALDTLKAEFNSAFPNRDKGSDGGIGDESHALEGPASDHNPHVLDDAGTPVVTAYDLDTDLIGDDADQDRMWDLLQIAAADPRLKYVIFDRLINYGNGWIRYYGTDPHTGHAHISVKPEQSLYDDRRPWLRSLGGALGEDDAMPTAKEIAQAVWEHVLPTDPGAPTAGAPAYAYLRNGYTLTAALPENVWEHVLPTDPGASTAGAPAYAYLRDGHALTAAAAIAIERLAAAPAGTGVSALTDADLEAIAAAVVHEFGRRITY